MLSRQAVFGIVKKMPMRTIRLQREYQRLWMKRRRRSWFRGRVCAKCGSNRKLQLDHRDPRTKVTHCIWSWARWKFLVEVRKCQVLCKKCHLLKTREDYLKFVTHCPRGHKYVEKNTHIRARSNGWSCRVCRTCDREYRRARRARGLR